MKIICIGRNYAAHAAELQNNVPDKPVIFLKPNTALLKNNSEFYYPSFSANIHYECEVVLRIGKKGKYVEPEFALQYIDAYSLGLDFTARDLQDEQKAKGLPWEIAKAFDNSAVVGDWNVFDAKAEGVKNIQFNFYQNGILKQQGDTGLMLFSFEKIISYVSQFFSLQQGDIIFTGTPAGVDAIQIGDVLEAKFTNDDSLILKCVIK
jgi:2-keto-4-pentenoate hydratase/2-oxohepta-3-ene-1,7-dioic acid hydratase in catechol pathway